MHWSPAIGVEARAVRETAGLFDESSFAKAEIAGPGAAAFLETLCDNEVARGVGQITYTQMLNAHGGIECDFTVTRIGPERFGIVTGTAFGGHDLSWIRRRLEDWDAASGGAVQVVDTTSAFACFALWGPRARDVLDPLTPDPLDDDAFPYMTMREITVGHVPVRALRVTFVGELGWELYCPTEYGAGLWRALWEAGRAHGVVAGGYKAIDALRLEKGYRVWAADITPDETPDEAGLGFCVRLDKPGGFVGRDALAAAREDDAARPGGEARRLRCIVLDDPRAVALGNEPVRVDGEIVGRVTSGGYGYTVARSIAYAYLPRERGAVGTAVEIDVFGTWVGGTIAAEPLYDPRGERLRG
jgi:glycine cleavage system aminomethyltransferase T